MDLIEFNKSIQAFDIEKEIVESVELAGDEAAQLVRGQLSIGITGEDKKIKNVYTRRTTYSLWWELQRRKFGKQVEFFDLRYTGEFTSKIYVTAVTPTSFAISSRSLKTPDLEAMFTRAILKMTPESRAIWERESFKPELAFRFKTKLGLNYKP